MSQEYSFRLMSRMPIKQLVEEMELRARLTGTGIHFGATNIQTLFKTFKLNGITCGKCVTGVEAGFPGLSRGVLQYL